MHRASLICDFLFEGFYREEEKSSAKIQAPQKNTQCARGTNNTAASHMCPRVVMLFQCFNYRAIFDSTKCRAK